MYKLYAPTAKITLLSQTNDSSAKKNINLVASVFHLLLEKKQAALFANFMSPELKIHKNNEVLNYQQVEEYVRSLNSKYKKVQCLPFDRVIACGNTVVVQFTERLYSYDGSVTAEKFISIFEIKNDKIDNIHELGVPAEKAAPIDHAQPSAKL